MSVECCGTPRSSRFCPDCGAELVRGSDDALALLAHCRRTEKGLRTEAAHCRESEGTMRERAGDHAAAAAESWAESGRNAEARAARWKAWGDALAALLEAPAAAGGRDPPGLGDSWRAPSVVLGLPSVRARRALLRGGLETFGDVADFLDAGGDLGRELWGVGPVTARQVRAVIDGVRGVGGGGGGEGGPGPPAEPP